MNAVVLRVYLHESRRHHGMLLYDWLLEQARRQLHIHGGSAFRAVAGYGRHGVLHEQHFFELEGELPVAVEFVVTETEADQLLALIRAERLDVLYTRWAAEFGTTGVANRP
jgi:PII-like signaling protein